MMRSAQPQEWTTRPMWSAVRRVEKTGRPELPRLSVYREHGVVRTDSRNDNYNKPGEDLSTYKVVQPGNLVLNKMKTWQGSLGVSPFEGLVSPAYFVCEVDRSVHGPFLHHLLRSTPYIALFAALSKGIRPNQWDLPYDEFRGIKLRLPDLPVQRRIADFLDDQVTRIDAAHSARVRARLLVEEQFSAWLDDQYDDFVQHVGAAPLRRHLLDIRQGWSPQCEDQPPGPNQWGVLKSGCVNGGRFDATRLKTLPDGVEPRRELIVRAGDLLVNRASGSLDLIGSAAVVDDTVPDRILLCDKVYRLRLAPSLDPNFYAALWSSGRCREELKLSVSGAEGMANSLPSSAIRSVRLPVPGLGVQRDWLVQLHARTAAKDALAAAFGRQEVLLQERKRALITAAVTGEFDVSSAGTRAAAAVTT